MRKTSPTYLFTRCERASRHVARLFGGAVRDVLRRSVDSHQWVLPEKWCCGIGLSSKTEYYHNVAGLEADHRIREAKRIVEGVDPRDHSLEASEWEWRSIPPRSTTQEDLRAFEREHGVSIPGQLRISLLQHSCQRPIACVFRYQNQDTKQWYVTEMMGLAHCLRDVSDNNVGQALEVVAEEDLAVARTKDGGRICVSSGSEFVFVLHPEHGPCLAGNNWQDFLWRMRMETGRLSEALLQGKQGDVLLPRHIADLAYPDVATGFASSEARRRGEQEHLQGKEPEGRCELDAPRLALPWDPADAGRLRALLSEDRCRSLHARITYYFERGCLGESTEFLNALVVGRHAVWAPPDPLPLYAHSIGASYLYEVTDVLILPDPSWARKHALTQDHLGRALNEMIRAQVIDGANIEAGTSLAGLPKAVENLPPDCAGRFEEVSVEEAREFLHLESWFSINFLDLLPGDHSVLMCRINEG